MSNVAKINDSRRILDLRRDGWELENVNHRDAAMFCACGLRPRVIAHALHQEDSTEINMGCRAQWTQGLGVVLRIRRQYRRRSTDEKHPTSFACSCCLAQLPTFLNVCKRATLLIVGLNVENVLRRLFSWPSLCSSPAQELTGGGSESAQDTGVPSHPKWLRKGGWVNDMPLACLISASRCIFRALALSTLP